MMSGVKNNMPVAVVSNARPRNRCLDDDRTAEVLGPGSDIQGMEAVYQAPVFVCVGDGVQSVRRRTGRTRSISMAPAGS